MLKLCAEADPTMTESTKLKHLLSKAKSSIQFEVRRKKPITPVEFLEFAREAEELLQLSNITIDNNFFTSNEHSASAGGYHQNYLSHNRVTTSHPQNQPISTPSRHHSIETTPHFTTFSNHDPSHSSQTPSISNQPYTDRRNFQPNNPSDPIRPSHHTNTRFQSMPQQSNNNYRRANPFPANPSRQPRSTSHITPLITSPTMLSSHNMHSANSTSHNDGLHSSDSSLIFLNTLVNQHPMKILIDTDATTTFISQNALFRIHPALPIRAQQSSFVLADGIAPF